MGVSLYCEKTNNTISFSYGGFSNFRTKLAYTVDKELGKMYDD